MTLPVPLAQDRPSVNRGRLSASRDCRGLDGDWLLAVLLLSGLANVDAALEEGAIFDADALRHDVAGERAFVADVNAVAGRQVAANFAEHNHFAGVDVRGNLAVAADGHAIARKLDRTFDLAIDVQRLGAGNFALDYEALADRRLFLGVQDGVAIGGSGSRFSSRHRTRDFHGRGNGLALSW